MNSRIRNEVPILEEGNGNIPLFMPYVAPDAKDLVSNVLSTRWIGQGPLVKKFEEKFEETFLNGESAMAVGSGTDALHLSYLLSNIGPGDEVIVPVFTCTATNIPLLYIGAKLKFVDVNPLTLNIDIADLKRKISKKTRAIVVVHYGGLPCEMDEILELAEDFGIPVIEDAAHALGAIYKGRKVGTLSDFTMYSFQAVKHITTGDGGMLAIKNQSLIDRAMKLRWFGIDRSAKQKGIWENDITEIGYKYQMTDVSAALGLTALDTFNQVLEHRQKLLAQYQINLAQISNVTMLGAPDGVSEHAAWLCTIRTSKRRALQEFLFQNGVESNQVHYRNDRYTIFSDFRNDVPNMDSIENEYLVLPLHNKLNSSHVDKICNLISDFFKK